MTETICTDNRLEVIAKAKEALLKQTNIIDSPEEMSVLDTFLMRCWQVGWLEKYDDGADTAEKMFRELPKIKHDAVNKSKLVIDESVNGPYLTYEKDSDKWYTVWKTDKSVLSFPGNSMHESIMKAYFKCKETGLFYHK